MGVDEFLAVNFNKIPHPTERSQFIFGRAIRCLRVTWIRETLMKLFPNRGEKWALLAGIVANRNDIIERDMHVLIGMIGRVVGNVDTVFGHYLNGERVYAFRINTSAVNLYPSAVVRHIVVRYIGKVLEVALSQLRAG